VKSLVNVVALGKGTMPAYRSQFSDADIAALLTYIRSSWGNGAGPVTTDQIAGAK
jgi:mono/diheme cytochrome c family protein